MCRKQISIFIPKYPYGVWTLKESELCFMPEPIMDKSADEIFKRSITPAEELLFETQFRRGSCSRDGDVVTIQDIKDVVLFLAKPKRLTATFIDFFHTETVDTFLNDLVIYFEYYLQLLEFMVIRRDEMRGPEWKLRSTDSDCVEYMLSEYMTQYRILLGRSYSRIILGQGDVRTFHHMANGMHQSYSGKDQLFTELFFACCKQFVWIAHHRRVQNEIDYEFDRLFRSEYFQLDRNGTKFCRSLAAHERRLLYGRADVKMQVFRQQSPLILELMRMRTQHLEVLWLADHKYEGHDLRMQQLEYEYTLPDAQLFLANVQHGILGHPIRLYSKMLELDWMAVRREKFSLDYDPYRLIRQAFLQIPDWQEFTRKYKYVAPVYRFISRKFDGNVAKRQRRVWKAKEKLMKRVGNVTSSNDIYKEVCNVIK